MREGVEKGGWAHPRSLSSPPVIQVLCSSLWPGPVAHAELCWYLLRTCRNAGKTGFIVRVLRLRQCVACGGGAGTHLFDGLLVVEGLGNLGDHCSYDHSWIKR